MKRFAVFVSGNGSNLQAIIDAVKKGTIKADLALVISNNPKAFALKRAEQAGIKTLVFERQNYTNTQSVDRDMVITLKEAAIDFVVLAGYMRILTAFFIKEFPDKILNIHPSLLPSFKGAEGIKDAYSYGVKITGVTVHFVNEKVDAGAIILQEGLKIRDRLTIEELTEKIHRLEHRVYPKAIALYADGRLKVKGRKVVVLDKVEPKEAKGEHKAKP